MPDVYDHVATAALEICVEKGWATVCEEDGERVYSLDARGRGFIDALHESGAALGSEPPPAVTASLCRADSQPRDGDAS